LPVAQQLQATHSC